MAWWPNLGSVCYFLGNNKNKEVSFVANYSFRFSFEVSSFLTLSQNSYLSLRLVWLTLKSFFAPSLIQIRHWMCFLKLQYLLLNQKNDFFCEAISCLVISNMSAKLKVTWPYLTGAIIAKMEKWNFDERLAKPMTSSIWSPMPWGALWGMIRVFIKAMQENLWPHASLFQYVNRYK